MKAIHEEIDYITVVVDHLLENWHILVYTQRHGSFRISLEYFRRRSLSVLWVLLNKVKNSSEVNELLRDKFRKFANHASPQIIREANEVRFLSDKHYRILRLDEEFLQKYPVKIMIEVETMLRTKGFKSQAKTDAADKIRNYCLKKNIRSYIRKMPKIDSSQPSDLQPAEKDPTEEEVLWQLARGKQMRLFKEPILPEEPATEEVPMTPVHKSANLEEGELDPNRADKE